MPPSRPAPLLALALLAAASAAFAPAPVYREPRPGRPVTDKAKMQGAWEQVSCSLNGVDLDVPRQVSGSLRRRPVDRSPGSVPSGCSFKLDPASVPKRIDLHHEGGRVARGIYRLERDRMVTCYAFNGQAPADFKAGPGVVLEVFRRAPR